ncbi:hypothetical protein [Botryobacter ruber]|uniref:hypothetical protein n=1 Tax=Botryobacter ruber TaxID=2171629 RepID=UPI000E0CBAF7|nr:hypothetical protein [Botryobacter ruber]
MNPKIFNFSLVLLVIAFLTGCASKTYLSRAKEEVLPPLNLAYHVQSIEILDERVESSTEEMKLPIVSRPDQLIRHRPFLTPPHKAVIEKVIQDNALASGTPVRAVVTILESYKEFSATWSSEMEKGFAQVQIRFVDIESGEPITGCDSSGEFFIQSMDATPNKMEEVYQITLKRVVYNCLKYIQNS